ncbi:hypothetical protein HOL63_01285 [Candidatus Peregrinibacteria bacterium]|jgi:hypothetical protein|nr:hypothetical protein [Candidatus Peregrinibacteria bacterium]MBT5468853.1 hypothetical protein [Candidatus Peregrinibacteria bacterium]MBT7338005.1 hypothetical protein [Candidatus Peregrinibacteria bacterium]
MGPLDLIRHPLIFTGITVPEFLRWYFWEQPSAIMRRFFDYLRAFIEIFSFIFLVRTLFSPWRQIKDKYPDRGINIAAISEAFTLNMVSRTIGFLFRIVTLFIGIAFIITLTVVFAAFYLAWLVFPLLFWVCISYLFTALI